jgi:hypothetical protein
MPRSLTMHRTVVTPNDRARFLERCRARAAHFRGAGCQYWVFEEHALPGAFIEFCEAPDLPVLRAAQVDAPDRPIATDRTYSIVELT